MSLWSTDTDIDKKIHQIVNIIGHDTAHTQMCVCALKIGIDWNPMISVEGQICISKL